MMSKMNETMVGGEAIARTLKNAGVEYVFGMTGGQTPFTASVIAEGIKMATIHNERCGSLMATGYSRVSGKPGVCTAADIGTAHLAVGLHEAYHSSNAVVAITNDLDPSNIWKTEGRFVDQEALFSPISKLYMRAESVDSLPDMIMRALEVATTGDPGPVVVTVPNGLLAAESDFEFDTEPDHFMYPRIRLSPDTESIARAAKLLLEAKNPAILAGGGVMLSRAADELVALAEQAGIPVATTHMAHGSFPNEHPLSVGVLGDCSANGRGRVANSIVGEADAVLLIGTRADGATTRGWSIPSPQSTIIQIGIDPQHIGSNLRIDLGIVADARLAIVAIRKFLSEYDDGSLSERRKNREGAVRKLMDSWKHDFEPEMVTDQKPIRSSRALKELQNVIDNDTLITFDAGSCSYWGAAFLDATPQNHVLHPRGFPALGSALPMAMGAQLAAPNKRMLSISGDGAFGYNVMELETAVRLGTPIVNVILNNNALGMEWKSFRQFCGEALPDAVRFGPQNFSRIAEAYGCFGIRVEDPNEIVGAVKSAFESGKPSIVEIMTDPTEDSTKDVPWQSK
jgi:acetolactate synthase I/II/III large subunit